MGARAVRQQPALTKSCEHYLRTILDLREERGYARVVDIAARMGLTKGSVSAALTHLAERGLVRFDAARFPVLTPAGRRVALDVRGRFQIILTFLTEVLGLPAPLAAAEACRWEHVVSHDVADRILDYIRFTADTQGRDHLLESFAEYRRSCAEGATCSTCSVHGPLRLFCAASESGDQGGRGGSK